MSASPAEALILNVDEARRVSALWNFPAGARATFVLAHGAGAGMQHPFLAAVSEGLGTRGIATLRYQFPYMEKRSRRPDPPELCHATIRAAVTQASKLAPGLPLFAGGKSFGGRMTSQAQAATPLEGLRGIAFLGFPLHAPGKAGDARGEHLSEIHIPLLFLQGTRDEFADLQWLEPLVGKLGPGATLKLFPDADHSFHVPARTGRKDAEVRDDLLEALAAWIHSTG